VIHSGELLDGYRAIRRIGAGGFGEVWLCRNEAFGDFRALKFIPSSDPSRLDREHAALCKYREESGKLLHRALMPVEHANRRADGLFYIMPLADGTGSNNPTDNLWRPLTLAEHIKERTVAPGWFSSGEVKALITPVLKALQILDDARLVHRDVKPANILFRNGSPCLSDISLLDRDLTDRARGGTYGFEAPQWYLEAGGHPDMYGAAATLFVLLTGKSPDKMAQSRHRWPPQGEDSLAENERGEWRNLHRLVARATDDDAARRFVSFSEFDRTLNPNSTVQVPETVLNEVRRLESELERVRIELKKQREEFESVSECAILALEEAASANPKLLADPCKGLAAVAERFETGLKVAKSGTQRIKALVVAKRASQALEKVGDKHGAEIGVGLEELRSAIERILKTDREFCVGQVRAILARALSLSRFRIGSSLALEGSTNPSVLPGAAYFRGLFNLVGLIFPDAQSMKGNAASLSRIIKVAKDFLEDQERALSRLDARSTKH
jgi:serine/threonine protein kinase